MTTLKFCMLALIGVSAAVIVKQWKADFLPMVRLALTVALGIAAINAATPILSYFSRLMSDGALSKYSAILFKALGIAVLTQCAADICRECGEASAASGVELTGKLEILLLCLPLIDEILSVATSLLTLGG